VERVTALKIDKYLEIHQKLYDTQPGTPGVTKLLNNSLFTFLKEAQEL
jgi:hypothetical protein